MDIVKAFYIDPSISREVSCKGNVLTWPIHVMVKSKPMPNIWCYENEHAFRQFKERNPCIKPGSISLHKIKPPEAMRIIETNKRACLSKTFCNATNHCTKFYIRNIRSKTAYLRSFTDGKNVEWDNIMSNSTLKYLERSCTSCGVNDKLSYQVIIEKVNQWTDGCAALYKG